jgi:hypothetical protein
MRCYIFPNDWPRTSVLERVLATVADRRGAVRRRLRNYFPHQMEVMARGIGLPKPLESRTKDLRKFSSYEYRNLPNAYRVIVDDQDSMDYHSDHLAVWNGFRETKG